MFFLMGGGDYILTAQYTLDSEVCRTDDNLIKTLSIDLHKQTHPNLTFRMMSSHYIHRKFQRSLAFHFPLDPFQNLTLPSEFGKA